MGEKDHKIHECNALMSRKGLFQPCWIVRELLEELFWSRAAAT